MQIKFVIAFATLILGAASLFAQATQTITGAVTDSMCGAHHMMKGKSAAECTRECVKEGSDYALASGNKVYTLSGDKAQFDKFAGQNVVIKGSIDGTTIKVTSIRSAK